MKNILLSGLVFATMSSAALSAEPLTEDRLDAITAGCLGSTSTPVATRIVGTLSSTSGLTASFTTSGFVFVVSGGPLLSTSTPVATRIVGTLSSTSGLTASFTTSGFVLRLEPAAARTPAALSQRTAGEAPRRSSTRPVGSLMTASRSEASGSSRSEGSLSGRDARAESHLGNARDRANLVSDKYLWRQWPLLHVPGLTSASR